MLSSLNAFGGLSAANLLRLFAANSASASATASPVETTSPGVSPDRANDPASAIKAILAQAQIDTPATPLSSVAAATAAYAAQTENAIRSEEARTSAAPASAGVSENVLAGSVAGHVNEENATNGGVDFLTTTSASSVSSASGSVDNFQLSVAIGDDSVSVGFSLGGLGPVQLALGGAGVSVGNGPLTDFFQIMVGAEGQGVGLEINVTGLDAAQAKDLAAAFGAATSAPSDLGASSAAAGYSYDQSSGQNFSTHYSVIVGY